MSLSSHKLAQTLNITGAYNTMRASEVIRALKAVEVPFDAELTNSEFGIPECQYLVGINHGPPFIVLRFGDEKGLRTSEAISLLEELAAEAPFDPLVTDGRLGEGHQVLKEIYHDPPVTVLDFV